jgi:hypothetical protein
VHEVLEQRPADLEAQVSEYFTILCGIGVLIGGAGWLLSLRGATVRSTHCVVLRHTKPTGLEIIYQSRSVGACKRYVTQGRRLGHAPIVMTRSDVDAVNVDAISSPEFWRAIRALTAGTPAEVANLARDGELLAVRLASIAKRIADVAQSEPLTKIDGIPIGPEMRAGNGRPGNGRSARWASGE